MLTMLAPEKQTLADMPTVTMTEQDWEDVPHWLAGLYEEYGPVVRLVMNGPVIFGPPTGNPEFVYMLGPEANQFILHTHRHHFSHDLGWTPIVGPLIGKGLLNMDGLEHDLHRRMMNPAFTVAYMTRYLPIMQRVIADRTRDWVRREVVDLYDEMRKITFDVAAEALVGFGAGLEVDRLRDQFFALFHGFDADSESRDQFLTRMMMTQRDLNLTILAEIAKRRQTPTDDILGFLVQARDDQGRALSDEQLLAHVNILLVAGHETTTTLSAWLFYVLAGQPDHLARVRVEIDQALAEHGGLTLDAVRGMKRLGWVIDEVARLHAPVRNAPRGVVKEFEFAGYTIPVGTQVRYSIAASHLLPHIWTDPDTFDPDRFAPPREEHKRYPFAFIPFGAGPRICIGMNFAQVEIKAMAAHILRAFDLTPIEDPSRVEYGFITNIPSAPILAQVSDRL